LEKSFFLLKSQMLNQINPLGEGKEQIKSFKLTHNPILLNIEKTKVKTSFFNISIGLPNFSQTKQIKRFFFCLKFCQVVTQKKKVRHFNKGFFGKISRKFARLQGRKG